MQIAPKVKHHGQLNKLRKTQNNAATEIQEPRKTLATGARCLPGGNAGEHKSFENRGSFLLDRWDHLPYKRPIPRPQGHTQEGGKLMLL